MSYVQNAWYVAALAEEVTAGLMSRTILDNPTLLYRENGKCVALLDLCPHRFAPLSMGMIKDGNVQCPYHGLEFDGTGHCVLNPHGNGARPAALNVRAFPVVERDGLVWVWPGEAARADASKIPDYSCRMEPGRRTVGGHTTVDCSFRVLVDNLMDLGHAQYVHRANAQTDAFDGVKREVKVEAGAIHNLMAFPSAAPSPLVRKLLGGRAVDRYPRDACERDAELHRLRGDGNTERAEPELDGHAYRDAGDARQLPLFFRLFP